MKSGSDRRGDSGAGPQPPSGAPTRVRKGTLIGYGPAPSPYDPRRMSYYIVLHNSSGKRLEWGDDLYRGLKESRAQRGDRIIASVVGRDQVRLYDGTPGQPAAVTGRQSTGFRNRWLIRRDEAPAHQTPNAKIVDESSRTAGPVNASGPERAGALMTRLGSRIAERNFRNPQDRQRFVETLGARRASASADHASGTDRDPGADHSSARPAAGSGQSMQLARRGFAR